MLSPGISRTLESYHSWSIVPDESALERTGVKGKRQQSYANRSLPPGGMGWTQGWHGVGGGRRGLMVGIIRMSPLLFAFARDQFVNRIIQGGFCVGFRKSQQPLAGSIQLSFSVSSKSWIWAVQLTAATSGHTPW